MIVGGEIEMASNGRPSGAVQDPVGALIKEKLKYLVPMTIVFMTGYVGLTVLAGFAKDLVGMKVVGSVNVGYVLIAVNYLLSWLLAILYGVIARSRFDPLAAQAASEAKSK
jgi:uncharacterized membrane protein (DUF485 family)